MLEPEDLRFGGLPLLDQVDELLMYGELMAAEVVMISAIEVSGNIGNVPADNFVQKLDHHRERLVAGKGNDQLVEVDDDQGECSRVIQILTVFGDGLSQLGKVTIRSMRRQFSRQRRFEYRPSPPDVGQGRPPRNWRSVPTTRPAAASSGNRTSAPLAPRRISNIASDSRMRNASRIVGFDTPNRSISTDSAGSLSPSRSTPVTMSRRMISATTSAALGFRVTRAPLRDAT